MPKIPKIKLSPKVYGPILGAAALATIAVGINQVGKGNDPLDENIQPVVAAGSTSSKVDNMPKKPDGLFDFRGFIDLFKYGREPHVPPVANSITAADSLDSNQYADSTLALTDSLKTKSTTRDSLDSRLVGNALDVDYPDQTNALRKGTIFNGAENDTNEYLGKASSTEDFFKRAKEDSLRNLKDKEWVLDDVGEPTLVDAPKTNIYSRNGKILVLESERNEDLIGPRDLVLNMYELDDLVSLNRMKWHAGELGSQDSVGVDPERIKFNDAKMETVTVVGKRLPPEEPAQVKKPTVIEIVKPAKATERKYSPIAPVDLEYFKGRGMHIDDSNWLIENGVEMLPLEKEDTLSKLTSSFVAEVLKESNLEHNPEISVTYDKGLPILQDFYGVENKTLDLVLSGDSIPFPTREMRSAVLDAYGVNQTNFAAIDRENSEQVESDAEREIPESSNSARIKSINTTDIAIEIMQSVEDPRPEPQLEVYDIKEDKNTEYVSFISQKGSTVTEELDKYLTTRLEDMGITPNEEKSLIYGRGTPEGKNLLSEIARENGKTVKELDLVMPGDTLKISQGFVEDLITETYKAQSLEETAQLFDDIMNQRSNITSEIIYVSDDGNVEISKTIII